MYCVKCKSMTANGSGERVVVTKNGKKQLKAPCAICQTTKNRFLPNSYDGPVSGEGILDFIIAHPKLINGAVGLVQAAPALAGLAFAGKKIYDNVN